MRLAKLRCRAVVPGIPGMTLAQASEPDTVSGFLTPQPHAIRRKKSGAVGFVFVTSITAPPCREARIPRKNV